MKNFPGNGEITRRNFLKKSALFGAFTFTGSMFSLKNLAAMSDGFPIVDTTFGKLRGMDITGIKTFLGIRYGESTAGKNRFMPPVKPKKHEGIVEAFAYGPVSPQMPADPTNLYTQAVDWDHHIKSGINEDCLSLNVWTPALNDGGNRPVFFYIHGGGFTNGSGGYPFNGDPMARFADAVVITVNHRLGPLGFLDLGALGNSKFNKAGVVGMLDLVAALEWVNENIKYFGGNPNSVTILGQSGGGGKVSTLLAMPSAKGLFHKAIIQSGSTLKLGSRERSKEAATNLISELGINTNKLEDLQEIHWSKIIEAKANQRFAPIVDGDIIPTDPCDPVSPEISANVPIMVGFMKEDMAFTSDFTSPLTEENLVKWTNDSFEDNAGIILSTYRKIYPNATPFQVKARIQTDLGFGKNAITMAERKAALNKGNAYLYINEWPSPVYDGKLGSCHGVDLGLILANPRNLIAGNSKEARKMAEIMGSLVAAFGRTGNPNCDKIPNWPSYNADTKPTMMFNTEFRLEYDPRKEVKSLLDKINLSLF